MKITTKYTIYLIIGILVVFTILTVGTYAIFRQSTGQNSTNILSTLDCVNVSITGNNSALTLNNVYPLTNEEGKNQTPYNFTVKNNCDSYVEYQIIMSIVNTSNLTNKEYVKIDLEGEKSIRNQKISQLIEESQAGLTGQGFINNYTLITNSFVGNNNHTYNFRMWLNGENEEIWTDSTVTSTTLTVKLSIIGVTKTYNPSISLKNSILAQGGGKAAIDAKGNPDFSQTSTSADTGLYAADDEYGTSYYYRGDKELLNNNLIFGGFQWKIVRINGDGSIRIIYNGTETQFNQNGTMNTTGANTQIGTGAWNATFDGDAKYIGYMYGGANGVASTVRNGLISEAATYNETSNNAKTILDNWYQTNILGKPFEKQIANNIFCNDRQFSNEVGGGGVGAPGYGNPGVTTFYASYYRLITKKTPTLKCALKNDQFNVTDTILGNGALAYPVGLINAEETAMAGLVYNINNQQNYLNTNQLYWTISPASMNNAGNTRMFRVSITGSAYLAYVTGVEGLRPVLNLTSSTTVTGEGSAMNPYVVQDELILKDAILEQGGGLTVIEAKDNPDLSKISNSADTGLYASPDEYGMSYYYRGDKDLLNNNLIFGGFQWKITRINGNGSIRIIYNGTEAQFNQTGLMNTTGANTQIGLGPWNATFDNDAKYIGYMYGGTNGVESTQRNGSISVAATYNETSNNAKIALDQWYQNNIAGKSFEIKLADNIFCNDRQFSSEVGGGGGASPGYGNTGVNTFYASYYRLITNKISTLRCGLQNDRFTVTDIELGNGALTYPVGLISAEEAAMAGLVYNVNNPQNYLYTNQLHWTTSPGSQGSNGNLRIYIISTNGGMNITSVTTSGAFRPILNLAPDIRVTGEGSMTNPFKVK